MKNCKSLKKKKKSLEIYHFRNGGTSIFEKVALRCQWFFDLFTFPPLLLGLHLGEKKQLKYYLHSKFKFTSKLMTTKTYNLHSFK